jgi:Cu-Zn family superoxide dismutase
MKAIFFALIGILLAASAALAGEKTVKMYLTSETGQGRAIGTITARDTPYGTLFVPELTGLPPGLHGFHVHQNATCAAAEKDGKMVPGLAAGGHYDPAMTGRHEGPYGDGHLGDLPPLYVDDSGRSTLPVLAPRLETKDLEGRSLMIHAGGDNYSDHPLALGGGGARMACGVIE